ncbi:MULTISPECIES: hypothetical protein [Flavobacterium]|uniref:Uncharacterized protein n=1 Tax=Flavobacterium keumense TaxID=1306518 RepID=A0ABY8N533_9FLAO|nr:MULTISPECIES: hypothetical protein [Flavobacterium]WGK94748.1 hypothetical protein MG292_00545 [Flavobacterium keumense]
MIKGNRQNILLIDKKNKFSFLFQGFRKNKFSIETVNSILKCAETELIRPSVFFVVIYEPRDVIQLVKLAPISKSIIIGTVNKRLFSSFQLIQEYPVVDLSGKGNIINSFHNCLEQFLK